MKSALNRTQTSAGESTGRAFLVGDRGLRQALGRESQGEAHVRFDHSRCQHNDDCLTFLPVHTGRSLTAPALFPILTARGRGHNPKRRRAPSILLPGGPVVLPIARGVPAAERRPVHVLPDPGRRSVVQPMRRQIATNSCRPLTRGGSAKPFRVDPNGVQPAIESHLNLRLSRVASFDHQRSERANGTVLYPSGDFPKSSGERQHEFG